MSNIVQRAITGAIFVAVLVLCIVFGGFYFHILFGIIGVVGLNEFYGLFKKSQVKPNTSLGIVLGTLFYLFASWAFSYESWQPFYHGLILLGFPLLALAELSRKKKHPFENIGVTILGIVYVVLPLVLLNWMMWDNQVKDWSNYVPVLSIFILVWTSDTFAYLVGSKIGKHKLFERISPKKSWEGFFGGLIFACIVGGVIGYFNGGMYFQYMVLGIIIAIFGTIGDLIESMLKRSLNIKDSGNILPGHGGILDRIDAVLYVVPITYFYFMYI